MKYKEKTPNAENTKSHEITKKRTYIRYFLI